MRKPTPVWICDECGGPAKWTFIDEEVYYHCERQCDGFMQLELVGEAGLTDASTSVRVDR